LRRRLIPILALAVFLAFLIVVLYLNLHELDFYPGGSTEPPTGNSSFTPPWFPETIIREGREYRLELKENRLELVLQDRDGWYRLFWAGDDTYYYSDPGHFSGGLKNRTAHSPAGTWTTSAVYVPTSAEETVEFPLIYIAEYRIVANPKNLPGEGLFPKCVKWLSYRHEVDGVETVTELGWEQVLRFE
jgi:hypothetical protein